MSLFIYSVRKLLSSLGLCYLLTCKWSPFPSHITSGIFSLVNMHEKEEEFKHNRNWKTPLEYDVSHKKKNELKLRNPSS